MKGMNVYAPEVGEGHYILTPDAPDEPRIHGPDLFGVRPGNPFLYTIPASGKRPMQYGVEGLPAGLEVDPATGRITGTIQEDEARTYAVILFAENALGRAEKAFDIVVGETIGLTPPLGWNSWNCWTHKVDQEKVLSTARAMVEKGLKDYGWTYVNIDDTWQAPVRGGPHHAILGNEKFPDMAGMCKEIHDMGLKVGIYSTPWITSYAGHIGGSARTPDGAWEKGIPRGKSIGPYHFDENDATQWAEWGIDYLKYDWRPNDETATRRMAVALRESGRDIIYSLSNCAPLSNADVYLEVANAYRTTGDIRDEWSLGGTDHTGLVGITQIWDFHEQWAPYCAPGHFPDPDMLVVGHVGWGGDNAPTKLTPDEQYTHISLWSLWAAPLLIGAPVEKMDTFTLKLLCNPEVLAVNQDRLGVMGRTVASNDDGARVIAKPLHDGSVAIGLFNRDDEERLVEVSFAEVNLSGPQRVRDLWRMQDIGVFADGFAGVVQPHGVLMLRVTAAPGETPGAEFGMREYLPSPRFVGDIPGYVDGESCRVEIVTHDDDGRGRIFYTLDGSMPTSASTPYEGPFEIREQARIRAITVRDDMTSTPVEKSVTFLPPSPQVFLSDLEPVEATTGWGALGLDQNCEGKPLAMGDMTFDKGLGVHAPSNVRYTLDGSARRLVGIAGLDRAVKDRGLVEFKVLVDGEELFSSGPVSGDTLAPLDVLIPPGASQLELVVTNGGNGKAFDHANWGRCGFLPAD